jgi:hypothetical protein
MYREEVLVKESECPRSSCSNIRKRLLYWRDRALAAEKALEQMKELELKREASVSRCCK